MTGMLERFITAEWNYKIERKANGIADTALNIAHELYIYLAVKFAKRNSGCLRANPA